MPTPRPKDPTTALALDEYLRDKSKEGLRLFRKFQSLVEAIGPDVELSVSRTVVYFKRRRVFAGGFVQSKRLEIVIDLLREA